MLTSIWKSDVWICYFWTVFFFLWNKLAFSCKISDKCIFVFNNLSRFNPFYHSREMWSSVKIETIMYFNLLCVFLCDHFSLVFRPFLYRCCCVTPIIRSLCSLVSFALSWICRSLPVGMCEFGYVCVRDILVSNDHRQSLGFLSKGICVTSRVLGLWESLDLNWF